MSIARGHARWLQRWMHGAGPWAEIRVRKRTRGAGRARPPTVGASAAPRAPCRRVTRTADRRLARHNVILHTRTFVCCARSLTRVTHIISWAANHRGSRLERSRVRAARKPVHRGEWWVPPSPMPDAAAANASAAACCSDGAAERAPAAQAQPPATAEPAAGGGNKRKEGCAVHVASAGEPHWLD